MSNSSLDTDVKTENYYSDKIVTVKFRTDTNETLTQAYDLKTDIGSLRLHLHKLLNVDANKIVIGRQELTLQDSQTLENLGATSLGIFELSLRGDGIQLPKPSYYLPVVDVITVNMKQRQLVVEIERCSVDKPWMGGYRDRNNGKVYYHAATQTDFKPKMYLDVVQEDRQSQTCVNKGIGRSSHDGWTQTNTGADVLQLQYSGRLVRAKPYQSYQAWLQEDYVLASVLIIQRAYRKMVAHKRRRSVAKDQRKADAAATQPDEQSAATVTALELKQQHFYALYTMIGRWWKRERERIKKIEADGQRKAAQVSLLMKEIKFLLQVEKQRAELKYEMTKHDDMTFLNRTSKPKMFKNRSGKLLTVDTVGNQKARLLRDVYTGLQQTGEGAAGTGRAAALERLRAIVSGSGYRYKRDFLAAMAMERDVAATMGAGAGAVLRTVRARVDQMFRHFVRQPEANPEADAYYRPTERRVLNVYTCIRCKRNLAAADFSLESRANRTNVCAGCEWTEQMGHKRIDMAPYRRMLNAVRRDEMRLAAYRSECFLMQPTEVYRLVSVVWNERSAVGGGVGGARLNGLRLVRWRGHEPWSPWNCVLLTRAEAAVHCRLDGDPADCYDARFASRVAHRHVMARLLFGDLVRAVGHRDRPTPPLSERWKLVADRFDIKTRR